MEQTIKKKCPRPEMVAKRRVFQARQLLLKIGRHLNKRIPRGSSEQSNWNTSREEAVRDEDRFNKTLDQIEKLSAYIYCELDELIPKPDRNISDQLIARPERNISVETSLLEVLRWASAYIHNLVRKVETVGECTGTMIRGPRI